MKVKLIKCGGCGKYYFPRSHRCPFCRTRKGDKK